MTQVRIGGCGFMGMVHCLSDQKLAGVRIEAVCDRNPEKLDVG